MRKPTKLIVAALLLLFLSPAWGEIRAARHNIASKSLEDSVDRYPSKGAPSLSSDKTVYLLVNLGAASLHAMVVAKASADPIALGQALETGMKGTAFDGRPVEWSRGEKYLCIRFKYSAGRLGAMEARNTYPVGQLAAALRNSGLSPYAMVGVLNYAKADLPKTTRRGSTFRWYDFSKEDETFSTTVSGHVTKLSVVLFLCFMLLPPIIAVGMIALRLTVGRRSDYLLPGNIYRQYYLLLPTSLIVVLMVLLKPYVHSPHAAPVADIWLGSPSHSIVIRYCLFSMLALLAIATVVTLSNLSTFRGIGLPQKRSFIDSRIRKRLIVGTIVLLAIVTAGVVLSEWAKGHFLAKWAAYIGAFVMAFGHVVSRLMATGRAKLTPVSPMEELYRHAERAAFNTGYKLKDVKIDDGELGSRYVVITANSGHIRASRKAVEIMSSEELEYLILHEIAIEKRVGGPMAWVLCGVMIVTFLLPAAFLVKPEWSWALGMAAIGLVLTVLLFMLRHRRAGRLEPDLAILNVATDPEVVKSAIAKKMQYSPYPQMRAAYEKLHTRSTE